MSWAPGSRWVGVGGSGGGGGSPSTPSVGATMVWAPDQGINAGNQWEELSDIVANAPPGDGVVTVILDFTAATLQQYAADVTTQSLQRFQLLGGPGHTQLFPAVLLPAGVAAPMPRSIQLVKVVSTGGFFEMGSGSVAAYKLCRFEVGSGGVPPLQVTSGVSGALFEEVQFNGTGVLKVHSGASLFGQVVFCDFDANSIDNDAGGGAIGWDSDASTEFEMPQTAWVGRTRQGVGGRFEQMRHSQAPNVTATGAFPRFYSMIPIEPSGTPIDITMPASADENSPEYLLIHVGPSPSPVRLVPVGADTIMSTAGPYSFPATLGWSARVVLYGNDWRIT